MNDLGFYLIFHHARLDEFQQATKSIIRNINGMLHHHYLFGEHYGAEALAIALRQA